VLHSTTDVSKTFETFLFTLFLCNQEKINIHIHVFKNSNDNGIISIVLVS